MERTVLPQGGVSTDAASRSDRKKRALLVELLNAGSDPRARRAAVERINRAGKAKAKRGGMSLEDALAHARALRLTAPRPRRSRRS